MNDANTTPLMIQYQGIKDNYPDCVLFFRLGDFYEMFNDDAIEVSKLLNLTLTHHRQSSPMCGIPFHAAKVYIARLLRYGKKIAICEQTSVPTGKGLTERKVVEVITPGTTVEEDFLDRGMPNYLASLCCVKKGIKKFVAFSWLDVSTATFFANSWAFEKNDDFLPKELSRVCPKELLLPLSFQNDELIKRIVVENPSLIVNFYPDWHFDSENSYKRLLKHFKTVNLRSFNLDLDSPEIVPAGFLIDYASKNLCSDLSHVTGISLYQDSEFLSMDESSQKNLELTVNLRDGTSQFTLLEVLNHTVTPMGNRLLLNRLLSPLTNVEKIKSRQHKVNLFFNDWKKSEILRKTLTGVSDIERLASRIAMDRAHAKDLQALGFSLEKFVKLSEDLSSICKTKVQVALAGEISQTISSAICDNPSVFLTEGNLIRTGWSEELDRLHEMQKNFNSFLDNYLEEEKSNTGISNLKIRYNRIIGYYIEVTKAQLDFVPDYFIRRQSLVNAGRFSTEKLIELERELLSAADKIINLEKNLFLSLRDSLKTHLLYFFELAKEIADLDVSLSNAFCARSYNWVCPQIDEGKNFCVTAGRHPVVEFHLKSNQFVPNSVDLTEKSFALITGPNMAGKSTFLRQNALIAVLAQMGSFVPAEKAHIGIIDRIFCRVGASDNLARGESTFLVEMIETANILRSATEKSLVIMDEVGRGTSTEDGLSIAWAVSEYLLNNVKSKTLFATHYHELTKLNHNLLQLLFLEVIENEGSVVFLKRIKSGAAMNSYGLHVAKLAGVPQCVIDRAKEVICVLQNKEKPLESLETSQISSETKQAAMALFSDEELVLNDILSTNPDEITPIEALQKISMWKKTLNP